MLRSIVAALFAVLLAGPAFAADKVTLMLNWYVYGEHAPFYYGKEKGYLCRCPDHDAGRRQRRARRGGRCRAADQSDVGNGFR